MPKQDRGAIQAQSVQNGVLQPATAQISLSVRPPLGYWVAVAPLSWSPFPPPLVHVDAPALVGAPVFVIDYFSGKTVRQTDAVHVSATEL